MLHLAYIDFMVTKRHLMYIYNHTSLTLWYAFCYFVHVNYLKHACTAFSFVYLNDQNHNKIILKTRFNFYYFNVLLQDSETHSTAGWETGSWSPSIHRLVESSCCVVSSQTPPYKPDKSSISKVSIKPTWEIWRRLLNCDMFN